ncbi:hypothetical protein AA0488_2410 [Kozakia baliensis NRIC 0488]|nr:hypothetical protein AA0488_2410 [Kozakia baliensis NRIC 0488]
MLGVASSAEAPPDDNNKAGTETALHKTNAERRRHVGKMPPETLIFSNPFKHRYGEASNTQPFSTH